MARRWRASPGVSLPARRQSDLAHGASPAVLPTWPAPPFLPCHPRHCFSSTHTVPPGALPPRDAPDPEAEAAYRWRMLLTVAAADSFAPSLLSTWLAR